MNGRLAGLLALLLCELLGGLSLRNEALAARARAEALRRQQLACLERRQAAEARLQAWISPAAAAARLAAPAPRPVL
ncbi:MAG: hypothetical protein D6702_02735 [Planctomycetota bacterium]|nr:MAG: hypothetical protein D6702_02735 [Planctomycetota bacterium]